MKYYVSSNEIFLSIVKYVNNQCKEKNFYDINSTALTNAIHIVMELYEIAEF